MSGDGDLEEANASTEGIIANGPKSNVKLGGGKGGKGLPRQTAKKRGRKKIGLQKTRTRIRHHKKRKYHRKRRSRRRHHRRSRVRVWRGSTPTMRFRHHATFAHLIHDALMRLNCRTRHVSGFSKRAMVNNIAKHYNLKLGRSFKKNLRRSITRLVAHKKLIVHGSITSSRQYTPT